MNIELGDEVEDKITQFTGLAYGRATYLTGCDQICVVPKAVENDYKSCQWIDEGRLKIIAKSGFSEDDVKKDNDNGGPRSETPSNI